MPDFDYDFSVFIGRFQPFHLGHHYVVSKALEATEHVIVLIGSAHQPRSLRNPFSFREREQQLRTCFSFEQNQRIFVAPLMDVLYNEELWIKNVQETIYGFVRAHHKHIQRTPSIALIGHRKDHSSYYLNLFPQWDSI
ncbi:MAG: adenylyltransferase/cytidyltransferase family protein, partial [Myxococcota bacterium]